MTNNNKSILIILGTLLSMAGCATEDGATSDAGGSTLVNGLPGGSVSLAIQGAGGTAVAAGALIAPMAMLSASSAAALSTTSLSVDVTDAAGTVIGALTLTDARVALKEIKIKLAEEELDGEESDEDGNGEIEEDEESEDEDTLEAKAEEDAKEKFHGPYVVNLLTDDITPALPAIDMVAGSYDEIELKLHKVDGSEKNDNDEAIIEETDGLFENSVYVSGTYTGLTASGPVTDAEFVFSYDLTEEFELTGEDASAGFEVVKDVANPIVIAFQLASWFAFNDPETNSDSIDFSQVETEVNSNGNTIISLTKDSNDVGKELREVIRDNIKESADYGKDSDDDGELEENENDDLEDDIDEEEGDETEDEDN